MGIFEKNIRNFFREDFSGKNIINFFTEKHNGPRPESALGSPILFKMDHQGKLFLLTRLQDDFKT